MLLRNDIEIVEGTIDRNTFTKKYFHAQKPVIIKNVAKDQFAGKHWTFEWLKNNVGDLEVDVFDSQKANQTRSAITTAHIKIKLRDYIDLLDKPTHYRIFLFDIFSKAPFLKSHIKAPEFFRSILRNKRFIFFGSRGSNTRIHQDIDMSNVLFINLQGRRRVILFPPDQSELIYRLPFNTFSMVDFANPDLNKFPALQFARGYEFYLEPGDGLFMPSGYWHFMDYVEPSMGVSFRKPGPGIKELWNGFKFLVPYLAFDKFMDFLFDEKWYKLKTKVAFRRANEAMNKHKGLKWA
ncbi:MAG: cupin-like domain-containing protein [Bacteroidia bacterium]|nr:cupin-like domain-containing protein [Bacteroidia bacterium]